MDNNLDEEVVDTSTTHKETEDTELVSIYEYIAETYNKYHGLPKDFSLSKYVRKSMKEYYIPGKYEVVVTSIGEVHPNKLFLELFKDIYLHTLKESNYIEQAKLIDRAITESVVEIMAIDVLPDCIGMVDENWDSEKSRNLINMSLYLIRNSRNIETVKFAIGILGLINTENNENISNVLMVLALCEDFTYFCNRIIEEYKDGNDRLIEILTRLQGWGKFDILKLIKIEDASLALWIIKNGMKGTLEKELMAPVIASRISIQQFLEGYTEMDDEFLDAVGQIIEGLTSGSSEDGVLEKIPDYEILFGSFLDRYEKLSDQDDLKKYIVCIKECLERKQKVRELNISEQIILERINNVL